MTLSLWHALFIALGGVLILSILIWLVVRRSRPIHPVYCIHCWVHEQRVTVVTHAEKGRRWAICQDCVGLYWDFDDQSP